MSLASRFIFWAYKYFLTIFGFLSLTSFLAFFLLLLSSTGLGGLSCFSFASSSLLGTCQVSHFDSHHFEFFNESLCVFCWTLHHILAERMFRELCAKLFCASILVGVFGEKKHGAGEKGAGRKSTTLTEACFFLQ